MSLMLSLKARFLICHFQLLKQEEKSQLKQNGNQAELNLKWTWLNQKQNLNPYRIWIQINQNLSELMQTKP